ncbi:putative vacuolar ATPase assembly integral membrane protein Vma21 [Helianthus anomalus]
MAKVIEKFFIASMLMWAVPVAILIAFNKNLFPGRLIMHHVVALIAERQKGTCTNRSLSRLLSVMCLMSKA